MFKVLERLFQITAMSQIQGKEDEFIFYTLDNELSSHSPHIHICVQNSKEWKKFKGKLLKKNLKSICSLKLTGQKFYKVEDLQFEDASNQKLITKDMLKIWCKHLNTFKETNKTYAEKAFVDYLDSNGETMINLKNYLFAYKRITGIDFFL